MTCKQLTVPFFYTSGHIQQHVFKVYQELCSSRTDKGSNHHLLLVSNTKGPSEDNTVEKRREIAIRCLIVYLGEKEEDLFKQYSDEEELNADLAMQIMKIAIIGHGPATIIVEGSKILERIDVARSCALMMGVIYALNLTYPKQLKFTFEVFQKLCLELDGQKASSKVMNLKFGIFQSRLDRPFVSEFHKNLIPAFLVLLHCVLLNFKALFLSLLS
ncbi:uncharacterized protein LOC143414440 [Maylandia zebra]|uniref:uncharacterized protein LOC143414440 n=1 Tax=Maylandia zebra TaxID=106582 RepID=UPI00403CBBBC